MSLSQQVIALCLLDFSATSFGTIDHSILLYRSSSRFGFGGTVISWLTSYLSSRSFLVTTNSTSAQSPLRQGFPQGSLLGSLIFDICTTLSSRISDSSVGHHHHHHHHNHMQMARNNIRHFSCFWILRQYIHLQNTIDLVPQRMSSNLPLSQSISLNLKFIYQITLLEILASFLALNI